MTRVNLIIPTRGTRPEFLKHAKYLISTQTYQPKEVFFIDFPPENHEKDITKRYRIGYDLASKSDCDLLLFWEDDDFYAPNYIETVIKEWQKAGKPDILGTSYTWYYNLRINAYFKMRHAQRSSAMSTAIKPGLNLSWPPDNNPYTDTWLWMRREANPQLKRHIYTPSSTICIGIKHGLDQTGGELHTTHLHRYKDSGQNDHNRNWLKSKTTLESFNFYHKIIPFQPAP